MQARLRHVEAQLATLDAQMSARAIGTRTVDHQRGVGVRSDAVRHRPALVQRTGLGRGRVDEEHLTARRELPELRAQSGQLGVVATDVVHDAQGGTIADECPV